MVRAKVHRGGLRRLVVPIAVRCAQACLPAVWLRKRPFLIEISADVISCSFNVQLDDLGVVSFFLVGLIRFQPHQHQKSAVAD